MDAAVMENMLDTERAAKRMEEQKFRAQEQDQ